MIFQSLFTSQMPEEAKAVFVVREVLRKAGKKYVCPGCLKSYARFDLLQDHLKRSNADEKHEGLMEEEQSAFYSGYHKAIGWNSADIKPALPSNRAAAFEVDFVTQHKILQTSHRVGVVLQNLLDIAVASGMKYVCPQCIDKDFEYFNEMSQFRNHCRKIGDRIHRDLQSTDYPTFSPSYLSAMGRPNLVNAPFGLNRRGPRSFNLCLEISYVIQEKEFVP